MYKFIIILLLIIGKANGTERTTLYDFRFWTSPDKTRIVIDTQAGINYKIKQTKEKITLQIENAKLLNSTYKNIFFKDRNIIKTNILRNKNILNIFFKTKEKYTIKSFELKPNKRYSYYRLVIDLYNKNIKQTVKKITDKKIIVIDAGHGGEDSGALGYKKSKEKYITLAIAKKLAKKINKNKNMYAVLTRKGDYYLKLSTRIKLAQKLEADLFISIHADAVKRIGANGASVYTLSGKGERSKFAKQLERSENIEDVFGSSETQINTDKHLSKILWNFSRKDRNIQSQKLAKNIISQMKKIGKLHKKTPQKANFVVLKTPTIPSVLVETAFISNPSDEKRLNNNSEQNKITNAIYKGIVDYFVGAKITSGAL